MEQQEENKFMRSKKKTEVHKSALTLAGQCKHAIDWGGVKLPAKESDKKNRDILQTIEIQKAGARAVNRDERHHLLPKMYSTLL